jgi:hypothetical protein
MDIRIYVVQTTGASHRTFTRDVCIVVYMELFKAGFELVLIVSSGRPFISQGLSSYIAT